MRQTIILVSLVALLAACGSSTLAVDTPSADASDAARSDARSDAESTDDPWLPGDGLSPDAGPSGDAATSRDADPTTTDAATVVPDATDPADLTDPIDPTDPPNPAPIVKTFRVLHWNIAGGKENDCRAPAITAAVVRYVKDKNVDFVGLNETCPGQYESIRDALRQHWGKGAAAKFSAYVGDETGRVVGNAIFSRFNIGEVTRQKVGSDQYGTRNLLCAVIKPHDHLRFCSVHLTPGDAAARVQLGRVMDRLETWWTNRRDTVILSGDLNLHPNDPGLNGVYSSAANNAKNNPNNNGRYREVDDDDPNHCPGYGERSVPSSSGGPCGAGGKIDFIFARQGRIVDYNGDTLNIPNTCTGVCSDHRAVFGRLKLEIRAN